MMDFVEQTDWSRWDIEALLGEIEHHAAMMRGASLYNLSHVNGPAQELARRIADLEFTQRGLLEQVEYHRVHALDAEIEAQRLRAAHQWQPGTVAPEEEGYYQVFDEEKGWYDHRYYSVSGWGVVGDLRPPMYWRPIPPMPDEEPPQ